MMDILFFFLLTQNITGKNNNIGRGIRTRVLFNFATESIDRYACLRGNLARHTKTLKR